jgi:hypothetical protein
MSSQLYILNGLLMYSSIYCSTALCWSLAAFSGFLIFYTVSKPSWTGDQHDARPLPTYRTTQTKNKRTQTSMPWVGLEPTTSEFERAKTIHALDRAATVIGTYVFIVLRNPQTLMEPEISMSYSEEPSRGFYSQPDASSPHPPLQCPYAPYILSLLFIRSANYLEVSRIWYMYAASLRRADPPSKESYRLRIGLRLKKRPRFTRAVEPYI